MSRQEDFLADVVTYRHKHNLPIYDWEVAELPGPIIGDQVVFYSPLFGVVPGYLEQISEDGKYTVVVTVPKYGFDSDKPVRCTFSLMENNKQSIGKYELISSKEEDL